MPHETVPRAVIFDLDGTLADSAPDIAAALNVALAHAGHRPLALDLVISFVGGGARRLIESGLTACGENAGASRIDRVYADFLAAYAQAPAQNTVIYPGVIEVLESLTADGVALGVCTNKPAGLTQAILTQLALAPYFKSVVAANGTLPLKPSPAMLDKVLHDLDVPSHQTVMVGDSAADVGAAIAAGVRCILLSHGYSREPVNGLGADAVISGFDALLFCLRTVERAGIKKFATA